MLEPDNENTDAPTELAAPPVKAAKKTVKKTIVKKAPAKKAPAKKAAKKAATNTETKAPAKKTTKKAAKAAAPSAPEAPAETEATAPGVLFMAPAEEARTPRRRARKAAAPPPSDEPAPGEVDITAAEDIQDSTAEPEDVKEAAIEQATGARRRRRRGRRGRGGGGAKNGEEAAAAETTDDATADAEATEPEATEPEADTESTNTRRRRKRRRAGEEDADEPADPNTVTHVREPKAPDDGVQAVKGSTRLEAKRQRRKDGRETTRRRAPILSEAEFLARREAVERLMAVRQTGDRTQIAVLEDGILVEHYVTRASATSYVGNVYLGRVQNVLPSMEAAFVDIGKGRNGVLYAGEVNWDAAGLEGKSRAIENALKSGDTVLIQVTKDPIGHKGARLTSQVSLPGRFLVYVPSGGMTGISRRLPDSERHRLKAVLKKIVPEDAGVIVRTAAEGASEADLTRDVERLQAEWEAIQGKAKQTKSAPLLVHGEPDLATRVVRDVFNEDFKSLVVQGDSAWTTVSEYIEAVAPDLTGRMSRHNGGGDLFRDLRVDEQLMKALDRKVWLPSGGSLVIDRTEAMTVIDVNTGKFVGAGGNLEQTVTRNNLEAAEEIVRQLRLRDVGGIVVIDFIDMVLESNRELVLRRLTECLARDRTKHQVAEVTSLGLVQLTRKRVGEGLLEAFSETCEVCKGRGLIVHTEPVDKAGGTSADSSDGDRPSGRSKRKRGGRSSSPEPTELPPAATQEQRKAANAAISAIHKAAASEPSEGTDITVLELATDLLHAAASQSARTEVDESAATPEAVEPEAVEPEAAPAKAKPAKRRRRVASRPAGPPEVGSAAD
ncbi:MAG TPA: Rne/Rng family ribonuclease [Jatrophihabitans sp.]|nr:Rne/Rng family ribonuclease [Jatrophihabitans sp.]